MTLNSVRPAAAIAAFTLAFCTWAATLALPVPAQADEPSSTIATVVISVPAQAPMPM